mmetsp:Transcript_59809/g.177267  ORF Transcript_59809/g.177267 Transcript_59809/m.177267 type:complete len:517 (-) Transcript_59809:91-1641(-)
MRPRHHLVNTSDYSVNMPETAEVINDVRLEEAKIPPLPEADHSNLSSLLDAFTVRHQSHHRPIALVTSGGTATDLEVNFVRFLDNFSTGLRGAVSVEQFLRRGYAVIHLWREGSAAPYARALSTTLGAKQANHGLGFDSIGRLFECPGEELLTEDDHEVEMISKVRSEDPWLTDPKKKESGSGNVGTAAGGSYPNSDFTAEKEDIVLNRRILNSSWMQRVLRERSQVVKEGLLLTVPFRTVEEYLAKLRLCSEAIQDSQSLAVIYLAAAVSDFYIPKAKRSLHKIQSMDYGIDKSASTTTVDEDNCLTLKLHPVPKLIPALRKKWSPDAYVVSFKLETDKTILRDKAMLAMSKYGMNMVIGNILATRHQKVWCLQRSADVKDECEDTEKVEVTNGDPYGTGDFQMREISRSGRCASTIDELEDAMISHVVEKHFEYIANHSISEGNIGADGSRTALMAGAEAAVRYNQQIAERKRRVQKELYRKRVRDLSLTVTGHLLGMAITYTITAMLQKRFIR